ncbi:MAG: acyl-CoA reductase, partial [Eubacteriales bacterium]|nr:acyl-CoA reductase [Eubacteriales bacterium]
MKMHIWQGKLLPDAELPARLAGLEAEIQETLGEMLETETVLDACGDMADKLRAGALSGLADALRADGIQNPQAVLSQLADNIDRDALCKKLRAELGSEDPFTLRRVDYGEAHFERWNPMGVLTHITAGNAPIVAPMAAVEGLLSGNINILKVAGNAGDFPGLFLSMLAQYGNIGKFLYMLRISSSEKEKLQIILDAADCVSAWGGEDAIESIRAMTPGGTPVVTWGHKISFGYVTPARLSPDVCDALVKSVCRNDQQSCSSPQVALIDTDDKAVVSRFAHMLGDAFDRARKLYPDPAPDIAQMAEITAVTELHRADLCFTEGEIVEPADKQYRLLVSYAPKFMPSPLFRTLWVAPMRHEALVTSLRGMRAYLQTAGLGCTLAEVNTLTKALYRAGVTRVTPLDSTGASYAGEPHDGVFALPRFLKRVALRSDLPLDDFTSFSAFERKDYPPRTGAPLQGKKDYPPVPAEGTRVLMKSGGTTGDPIFCSYTERDYQNYIVQPSVEAFLAAGLDPRHDVVADLFKGGNLYGGMNAFLSAFDAMKAPHLSIGALDDYKLAAKYVITGRATVLISAPSYIVRLMQENEAAFKAYGRIKKVFYGGEHISEGQRQYLHDVFGVECIRSFLYGANETGSMGYGCPYCEDGVFHVFGDIQQLEILKMNEDVPAAPGELGRLFFTGFLRENGRTERYEIGDTGFWLEEDACPCGRKDRR